MRLACVVCLASLFAVVAGAIPVPITITDPGGYAGANPGGASNNGDVIGLLRNFDIDAIRFTVIDAMKVEAVIRVYYNDGDETLSPFNIGGGFPTLKPADLLFDIDGVYTYGVPLSGHDLMTAGALYQVVGGQPFTKDAKTVLHYGNSSSTYFRPNAAVWINASYAVEVGDNLSFGAVQVGTTSAVDITLSFEPNRRFLLDLERGVSVHFASATCGNDLLDGRLQYTVPEPMSLILSGGGLLALGLFGQRRRRKG